MTSGPRRARRARAGPSGAPGGTGKRRREEGAATIPPVSSMRGRGRGDEPAVGEDARARRARRAAAAAAAVPMQPSFMTAATPVASLSAAALTVSATSAAAAVASGSAGDGGDSDTGRRPGNKWTGMEKVRLCASAPCWVVVGGLRNICWQDAFMANFPTMGRDWHAMAVAIGTKTPSQVRVPAPALNPASPMFMHVCARVCVCVCVLRRARRSRIFSKTTRYARTLSAPESHDAHTPSCAQARLRLEALASKGAREAKVCTCSRVAAGAGPHARSCRVRRRSAVPLRTAMTTVRCMCRSTPHAVCAHNAVLRPALLLRVQGREAMEMMISVRRGAAPCAVLSAHVWRE